MSNYVVVVHTRYAGKHAQKSTLIADSRADAELLAEAINQVCNRFPNRETMTTRTAEVCINFYSHSVGRLSINVNELAAIADDMVSACRNVDEDMTGHKHT